MTPCQISPETRWASFKSAVRLAMDVLGLCHRMTIRCIATVLGCNTLHSYQLPTLHARVTSPLHIITPLTSSYQRRPKSSDAGTRCSVKLFSGRLSGSPEYGLLPPPPKRRRTIVSEAFRSKTMEIWRNQPYYDGSTCQASLRCRESSKFRRLAF